MRAGRLIVSKRAEADILSIWAYIAQRNPGAADRIVRDVEHKSRLLADNPFLGKLWSDDGDGTRVSPVRSYVLFYRVLKDESGVEILRCVDGRRDYGRLFI